MVERLRVELWIDGDIRVVFFDLNIFNVNSWLFSYFKVVFEIF